MRMKFGILNSQSAVLQSEQILGPIREANPHVSVELVTVPSEEDLPQALRDGRVDYAIRNLQDVPLNLPDDLPLVAYVRQADRRDCLTLPKGVKKLDRSKPLVCRSLRQTAQLQQLYPKMTVIMQHLPIPDLLDQLDTGKFSALVLPAIELKLLEQEKRIFKYFSAVELLPAAGQGILALQTRRGTDATPLKLINDMESAYCALAERAFAQAINQSSGAPAAGHAVISDGLMTLTGLCVCLNGTTVQKADIIGNPQQAALLGQTLATHMTEFDSIGRTTHV